jgi:hypothetical protein
MALHALRSTAPRRVRRHGAVMRAMDFLESRECALAGSSGNISALDCDWMLGAAVTADGYAHSSPLIHNRALKMASRLCSYHREPIAAENLLFPMENETCARLLRRTVLDKFGELRALSVQPSRAFADQFTETALPSNCKVLLGQFLQQQQQTCNEHPSAFRLLFGFCPQIDVPPSPDDVSSGDRTRWSHGLIFARMAEDLGIDHTSACQLSALSGSQLPSFTQCLRWIRQALPPVPAYGDTRIQFHSSHFWSGTEEARRVRKEEWYLRTHVVYTQVCPCFQGGTADT